MNLPLVSVCVPTYNGEAYLAEALASIEAQDYPAIEVIISDDGSADRRVHRQTSRIQAVVAKGAGDGLGWPGILSPMTF